MHRTLKPLVALTAGLALVALTAAPGAATLGTATAGTATLNFVPAAVTDLAPGGTRPCAAAADTTLDIVMTSATSGTATLNLVPSAAVSSFIFLGFLRLSGSGSVTISGSTITIGPIALAGNVYRETSPGNCVPDLASPRCVTMNSAPLTLTGTWAGTVTPPSLSGTAVLSGTTVLAAAGCLPPYSGYNGKTMTISNLTVPF